MNANAIKKAAEGEAATVTAESSPLGTRIGRIVGLDDDAAPLVDFPGNPYAPLRALLAIGTAEAGRLSEQWRHARVLIMFASQDVRQPVIAGMISESMPEACGPELGVPARLELEATEEVVLRCGDAKIMLKRDGKVAIGGREIDARAQQKHRIRGGTVSIN